MGNNLTILKLVSAKKSKPRSRAVITGGSSGIGREIAIQYSMRGYRLLLSARQKGPLEETKRMCESLGAEEVHTQVTDVDSEDQCKALVEKAVELFGGIDILVLCAGVGAHQLFKEVTSLESYQRLMKTNFFGYLYCTFYALNYLKESKGQILVVSSISGEIGLPFRTAYCASKFAVTGFFEALRTELDRDNVAITIVCPPSVKTKFRENSLVRVKTQHDNEHTIDVDKCVKDILAAADRRARKIYFPFKVYFAAYVRPFFPDLIDKKLKRAAKL